MEKKDTHLENFKQAISSTIKSISEISDCNVSFGDQTRKKDNKNANLPVIRQLEKFKDFSSIRAKADSEALRLKYSNINIFEMYQPKGNSAKKLYETLPDYQGRALLYQRLILADNLENKLDFILTNFIVFYFILRDVFKKIINIK